MDLCYGRLASRRIDNGIYPAWTSADLPERRAAGEIDERDLHTISDYLKYKDPDSRASTHLLDANFEIAASLIPATALREDAQRAKLKVWQFVFPQGRELTQSAKWQFLFPQRHHSEEIEFKSDVDRSTDALRSDSGAKICFATF